MRVLVIALVVTAGLPAAACNRAPAEKTPAQAQASSIPAPPDVAAPPADAERTPTGLVSRVLVTGRGARHPRPDSLVKVNYTGWTTDGQMFDSSIVNGQPAVFRLDGVIAGWTEGLQRMVEGEKRRFWIPAALAYPSGGGPSGMLVFDIELLSIES
jgi:FKBP-type peptidyl-prolyl cis-trans isomerase